MARPLLMSMLCLRSLTSAWQTALTLNLAWPALQGEGTITANGGHLVGPDDDFPCASIPVPANVARIPFPLDGGRLQYNLTNSTTIQSQYPGWYFISNVYLGQFSSDTTVNKSGWANLDTEVFKGLDTGPQCRDALNITQRFLYDPPLFLTLSSTNLVGVNVTLGLRTVLFGGPYGDDNEEEMFQCAYLTLTSPDAPVTQPRGVCNRGPVPSFSSSTTVSTQPTPTSTSTNGNPPFPFGSPTPTMHPIPTPTSLPPASPQPGGSPSDHAGLVVGLAVALPVSLVSLVAVIGTFVFLRCRKAQGTPTAALDFFVRGTPGKGRGDGGIDEKKIGVEKGGVEEKVVGEKSGKKEGEGGGGASESGSIRSEPLPVYDRGGQ